jgi:hypothetical protein
MNQARKQYGAGSKQHALPLLVTCLKPLLCLAYTSTMKMEAKCSSETSLIFIELHDVVFQKTEFFEAVTVQTNTKTRSRAPPIQTDCQSYSDFDIVPSILYLEYGNSRLFCKVTRTVPFEVITTQKRAIS